MAKTQQSVSVQIDVSAVRKLAADLKAADPEAAKELKAGLKVAAEIVATEARADAATFSKKIPGSIRSSSAGQVSAKVIAGGAKAPNAAPIENHGKPGKFRHPVFGNRQNWVDQPAHPFLAPAAERRAADVETAVVEAIQGGLAALGLDFA